MEEVRSVGSESTFRKSVHAVDVMGNRDSYPSKTGKKIWSSLFLLPCVLLYEELLLQIFGGELMGRGFFPLLLHSAGLGLIVFYFPLALSWFTGKRVWNIFALLLMIAASLYFTVESEIKSVFSVYMSPGNLFAGAGNVAKNYGGEMTRAAISGLLRFPCFFLPGFLVFFWKNKSNNEKQDNLAVLLPGSKVGGVRGVARCVLPPCVGAALLFLSSFLMAGGNHGAIYGAQYNFNSAVEAFGLLAASRLELTYSMLGNPYASFSFSSRKGRADGAAGTILSRPALTEREVEMPAAISDVLRFARETEGVEKAENDVFLRDINTVFPYGNVEREGIKDGANANASRLSAFFAGISGKKGGQGQNGLQGADFREEDLNVEKGVEVREEGPGMNLDSVVPGNSGEGEALAVSNGGISAGDRGMGSSDDSSEVARSYGLNIMDVNFSSPPLVENKTAGELSQYLSQQPASMKNKYTGLFQGKNLILVCAEAYCDAFIRPELTPTLWRLKHNGFHFSEYYQSEWGGSTTSGEVAFLLGIASNNGDESMVKTKNNNNYFSMGNQLQRQGYSSIAFHNGYSGYYHRDETHENLGYNQYVANGTGMEVLCGHGWPSDTEMMENTVSLYLDAQPFSVYYMTVSGHAPYEKSSPHVKKYYDRVEEIVSQDYYEKTKYYICYQMELENAMSSLVGKLEEAGIADDTVIVMTGDHYPYGLGNGSTWKNDRNYLPDLMKEDTAFRWNQDKSGLVIWSGCLEDEYKELEREIDTPVGNIDILPTLSNLFGLEYDSRLLPGRDALSEDGEPLVYWNNLSWVTERGKFDGRQQVYYPNEGYEDDPEYVKEISAKVNDRLLMSRSIVNCDYYGLLFGPDELVFAGKKLYEEGGGQQGVE